MNDSNNNQNNSNTNSQNLDVNSVFGLNKDEDKAKTDVFSLDAINNTSNNQNQSATQVPNTPVTPQSTVQNPKVSEATPAPLNAVPVEPTQVQNQAPVNQTPMSPTPNATNAPSSGQPLNGTNNAPAPTSEDEELLRAYVGSEYDHFIKNRFNVGAFILNSLYMFYRKMFGFGLLSFIIGLAILNLIKNYTIACAVYLVYAVVIGIITNKIYISRAKKAVNDIKFKNQGKSLDELKGICSKKGGTSIGKIFLGIFVEIIITIAILFVMMMAGFNSLLFSLFKLPNSSNNTPITNKTDGTLMQDVSLSGYSCFGDTCSLYINDDENPYNVQAMSYDLIKVISDSKDYLKLDIYYTGSDDSRTIVGYKLYLKSTGEDITNITDPNELIKKIGLYADGTYTESLTLTKIGTEGYGSDGDNSYTYMNYTFTNDKGVELDMRYINGTLDVTEGNKYNVNFEVKTDNYGDRTYTINSVS